MGKNDAQNNTLTLSGGTSTYLAHTLLGGTSTYLAHTLYMGVPGPQHTFVLPTAGLSLRGGGWGFPPATMNVFPGYFQRKIKEK